MLPGLAKKGVDVAVPSAASRLKTSLARNTVYRTGLPANAFLNVGDGVYISSPELLFVELAPVMSAIAHLMLGFELCGTFSRDPKDPRDGDVTFRVPPVTSVEKIAMFLENAHDIVGMDRARETLSRLSDNAWSPTEAVIATMARLPVYEMGYGCDELTLNKRVKLNAPSTTAASRVPDILFGTTKVGINYDGDDHLDLTSIEKAARRAQENPSSTAEERALWKAKQAVRAKVVDDLRRNRDLGSKGYTVFPVTKEDLYEEGGLDAVMFQVYEAIEHFTGQSMREKERYLTNRAMARRRQEIIWALLPGEKGKPYLRHLKRRHFTEPTA